MVKMMGEEPHYLSFPNYSKNYLTTLSYSLNIYSISCTMGWNPFSTCILVFVLLLNCKKKKFWMFTNRKYLFYDLESLLHHHRVVDTGILSQISNMNFQFWLFGIVGLPNKKIQITLSILLLKVVFLCFHEQFLP